MNSTKLRCVVGLDRLGEQRIEREGLVARAHHQRLEDVVAEDQVERAARGAALDDEGVEAVERARPGIVDAAALRRIGIGIGKMREIGRQRRLAMHGDGVRRARPTRRPAVERQTAMAETRRRNMRRMTALRSGRRDADSRPEPIMAGKACRLTAVEKPNSRAAGLDSRGSAV